MDMYAVAEKYMKVSEMYSNKTDADIMQKHTEIQAQVESMPLTMKIFQNLTFVLTDLATKPTEGEVKRFDKTLLKGKIVQEKKKALLEYLSKRYTVTADFRGEEVSSQFTGHNGAFMKSRDGKQDFILIGVEAWDFDREDEKEQNISKVQLFMENFSNLVAVTLKVSKSGISLKLEDYAVVFSQTGMQGILVFKSKPGMHALNTYIESKISGPEWKASNSKVAGPIRRAVFNELKKKITALHKAGVLFSVGSSSWLRTSDIVVDVENDKITSVYVLKYTSAALAADLAKRIREADMRMLGYLNHDRSGFNRHRYVQEIVFAELARAGDIPMFDKK
eukprot:jgi/Tetstr1/454219/TSEL_041138.t1